MHNVSITITTPLSHYIGRLNQMARNTKAKIHTRKQTKYSKKETCQDFYGNPDISFVRFKFINGNIKN